MDNSHSNPERLHLDSAIQLSDLFPNRQAKNYNDKRTEKGQRTKWILNPSMLWHSLPIILIIRVKEKAFIYPGARGLAHYYWYYWPLGGHVRLAKGCKTLHHHLKTPRAADASARQDRFLQALAIRELQGQKQRISTYQIQARYELAAIYDRAANDKPKAKP